MMQQIAMDILKMGYNVYLTGYAGTGKTYILNQYIAYLQENHICVGITASTGIAATQINGITINAWAGIGIKSYLTEQDISELLKRKYLWQRIAKTSVLIIDEVSMLPDYCLENIDKVCRAFKKDNRPFGGIQVVLCGDFFQLPPISSSKNISHFILSSKAWHSLDLKICYLDKEFRQDDKELIHVLNEIRSNAISKSSINKLASRLYKPLHSLSTRLYTHNVDVDIINKKELEALPGDIHRYTMQVKGNEYLGMIMKRSCLAPEVLCIKKDALVMFVKNNFEKGYVNGTLGTVLDFDSSNNPIVQIHSGELVTVLPTEWTIEENGKVTASITQLPLRLAWAITVHKSQGMSIDAAEIDLGKPFVPGMGYVALSRVRSLEGIRLMGLNHKAFMVNEEIVVYDKYLQSASKKLEKEYEKMAWIDLEVSQMMFLSQMKQ